MVCEQETQRTATIKGVTFNKVNTVQVSYTMYSYSKKPLCYYVNDIESMHIHAWYKQQIHWFIVESLLHTLKCQYTVTENQHYMPRSPGSQQNC